MRLFNVLQNLAKGIKDTLQKAKDYTDARGDYIVEQGISGIWTYRKWASGIAECWGVYTYSGNITQQYGTNYYGTATISFPTGLFSSAPTVNAYKNETGNLIVVSGYNCTASSWGTYIWNPATSLANYTTKIHVQARGLWKALEQVGGVILKLFQALSERGCWA